MIRKCAHCDRPFTGADLAKEQSKGMEAERKALGLQGVLFRYYTCPQCGYADIFIDLHRLEGESDAAFERRKADLEKTVRQLHGDHAEVVLTER